jgi:hypothetical protein
MAVSKSIAMTICKGETVLFIGTINDTLIFPPEYVGKVMELVVEGFKLEEDDHACLNDLHCHGHCNFSFGNAEWDYRVAAQVSYPK